MYIYYCTCLGAPYSGASAQRMGSASLRRFSPTKPAIQGSGAIANRAVCMLILPFYDWLKEIHLYNRYDITVFWKVYEVKLYA